MTVGELLEELKGIDPALPIMRSGSEGDFYLAGAMSVVAQTFWVHRVTRHRKRGGGTFTEEIIGHQRLSNDDKPLNAVYIG